MTTRDFGTATWQRLTGNMIGVKLTYRGSREKFTYLTRRLSQDLISVRWAPAEQLWVFPAGLLPDFQSFCLRYGLRATERSATQQRLQF